MSHFETGCETQDVELGSIQRTIEQISQLTGRIRQKQQKAMYEAPELNRKMEILLGQNTRLRLANSELQRRLAEKEEEWKTERKQLEREKSALQKLLEKKSKELNEKSKDFTSVTTKRSQLIVQEGSNVSEEARYKALETKYDKACAELEELRVRLDKDTNFEMGHSQISDPDFGADFAAHVLRQITQEDRVEELQRQRVELQNQLAAASHKICELFNVAFDIGGAKLLDRLQSSIGITERQL